MTTSKPLKQIEEGVRAYASTPCECGYQLKAVWKPADKYYRLEDGGWISDICTSLKECQHIAAGYLADHHTDKHTGRAG